VSEPELGTNQELGAAEVQPHVSRLNIANIITMFRILLVPVLAWTILAHHGAAFDSAAAIKWRLIAVGIFLLAAISDKIDGNLARSRGLITDLGKLLDPIADKALMGVALLLLWRPLAEIPFWVPAIILIRELGITWMRMRLLKLGTVMPASRGGKLKTVLQSVAIPFFLLPFTQWIQRGLVPSWLHTIAWIVMIATVLWTLITGIDYAMQGWKIYRDAKYRGQ
jgi:CDP-diacylglycerol---glycerol-3-phosphate 3-phosphatidyltransferase